MVKVSQEHAARLRRRVLDAALTELAVAGHAALTITGVAHRAGVATSAVYRRFPTKDHLVGAVAEERLEPMAGRRVDETTSWLWGPADPRPTRRRSAADHKGLTAWHQLLVAAAFPSGPQAEARVLLHRRLGRGLTCRAAAPAGTVRAGPDPTVQVLLPVAVDLGRWLLLTGLGRPSRQSDATTTLVRATVRAGESTPVATTTTPNRRVRRVPVTPPRPSHDQLGEVLLDATADAVRQDGFAITTVAGIALRAGSSTGAVYNRFSGKGGLLAACRLATDGTGHADRDAAVRIECLRVAFNDPEVGAAVRAVEGRALRTAKRSLAATDRDHFLRPPSDLNAASELLVAFPIGHWVLGQILMAPTESWRAAGDAMLEALGRGLRESR